VINILTSYLAPFPSYGEIFASESGVQCFTFTLSLGVIPSNPGNIEVIWSTFPLQKLSVHLQPLLHNPPQNLPCKFGEITLRLSLVSK